MKATINGKQITAQSLDELRSIARQKSKASWVYGEDEQGQFGFCCDPRCTCDKFARYNTKQLKP